MNKSTFFSGEYSYLIPPLFCGKSNGHVHSIFANGFNIKMGESLIFIGTNKNGRLPFGIHLTHIDTSRAVTYVKINETVFWVKETETLGFAEMSVSLGKGHLFKNELKPATNKVFVKEHLAKLIEVLKTIDQPTGLDINIIEFLRKVDSSGLEMWSEGEQHLLRLIEAVSTDNSSLIEKILRYFLGRGKGLTPSGDDLMVGILAFDAIAHYLSPSFYRKISELVEKEPITTDVSKEYLRYAVRHEFSSTVTDVINSIGADQPTSSRQAFLRLLEVGHSSGMDTLLGILIGILAYRNKNVI